MAFRKTAVRNRAVITAFEGGASFQQLGAEFRVTEARAAAIVADERNKRRVSQEVFYRNYRNDLRMRSTVEPAGLRLHLN